MKLKLLLWTLIVFLFIHTTYAATVLNASTLSGSATLSNGDGDGNLTVGSPVNEHASVIGTVGYDTGKRYFEITVNTPAAHQGVGIADNSVTPLTNCPFAKTQGWWLHVGTIVGNNKVRNSPAETGTTYCTDIANVVAGDIVMIAADFNANKLWFGINNVWCVGGDPANGNNEAFNLTASTKYFPAWTTCSDPAPNSTFVFGVGVNRKLNFSAPSGFEPWGGDKIPPEIKTYNMTSEGGCTKWNTNKSNPCNTSDTTPTVAITTDENAYCAIGDLNLNYTNMGSSRNCTSGEGTKSHTCTLISQDSLTQETSYIYISCKDAFKNENLTSTSGALKLNLTTTNLEPTGRDAIESGIQNALLSSYTIYTDQKIYARNSANNQAIGIFDKVVKWMNKIWAFNYLTGSDTSVNMFNITPVLYTLELANKSSSGITNQVESLINNTK